MTSSLAQSAQRLIDSQPLLPLDLSYSTLYGIYTGANTFNCGLNNNSSTLKVDLQDVENKMPMSSYQMLDHVAATTANALSLLDSTVSMAHAKLDQNSTSVIISNPCDSDGSSSTVSTSCSKQKLGEKRKELIRDQAYWERRRKNNDAAKRSRDSRRKKEDEVAIRAALLEQENLRLRFEVERLKTEIERHRVVALNSKIVVSNAFESLRLDWDRTPTIQATL